MSVLSIRRIMQAFTFFFFLAGVVAPAFAASSGIKMLPPMKETHDDDNPASNEGCPSNNTKTGQVLSWDGKTSIKCNSKLLVDTSGNTSVGAGLSVTGSTSIGGGLSVTGKTRPTGGLVLPTTAGNEVGQLWLDTSVAVGP